jgi:integrase
VYAKKARKFVIQFTTMSKALLKVNFYLSTPQKSTIGGKSSIILSYAYEEFRYRISTGLTVKRDNWISKKSITDEHGNKSLIWVNRVAYQSTGGTKINQTLAKFEKAAQSVFDESIEENRDFSLKEVRERILSKVNDAGDKKRVKPLKKGILEYMKEFIETKKQPSTNKKYKSLETNLKDFIKEQGKIDFYQVNSNLIDEYQTFLMKRYNDNTTYRYIKFFKTYLNYCLTKGYLTNDDFRKFSRDSFKVKPSPKTPVTINVEEFLTLWDMEVKPSLQVSKDVFLFMCVTGLRISDINQLRPQHIDKNFIKLETTKDRDAVSIPLTEFSRSILDGYSLKSNFVFKDLKARNNLSDDIKLLCKLAEINRKVEIVYFKNKIRVKKLKYLNEAISPHDGRKTFKSLALNLNVNKTFVDAILGHANNSVDAAYIQIHEKQIYKSLNRAFNRKSFEEELNWADEF